MSRGSAGIFLLLLLLHVGAVSALVQADAAITEPTIDMEPPKLQGMLIAPEPKIAPPPPKAEPETAKPVPKPVPKTVPKPPAKQPPLQRTAPLHKTPAPLTKAAAATPAPTQALSVTQQATASSKAAGSSTQLPSADAAGLNNKAPVYPLLSRKRKEQGTVWLLLLVSKEGLVTELKLKKSSGFDRLDQAALQAVKKWKFQPARQQGQPIDYWYELPLKFSLQQG